jgi:hypothetical protein
MATYRTVAKLERERVVLEAEYRDALVVALRECSSGQVGLFTPTDYLSQKTIQLRMPKSVLDLDAVGEELVRVRASLDIVDPFPLMAQFETLRKEAPTSQLGAPRLAEQFLKQFQKADE